MQYDKKKKVFTNHYPVHSLGDSNILIFGKPIGKYHQFKGIGQIIRISRGNRMDIVGAKFGMFDKVRDIVVSNSVARKQILTLKRGQWAEFYGHAKLLKFWDSKYKKYYPQWCFYAYCLQGQYVPKAFDMKKLEEDINNGEETNQIDELDKDREKMFQDAIDGLFGEKVDSEDIVLG